MTRQSKPTRKPTPAAAPTNMALPFPSTGDAPFIYASSMQMIVSSFDFMILVAQAHLGEKGLELQHSGTVVLAPGHAKVLAKLLTEKVAEFEATNGEIPLGPGAHTAPIDFSA